MDIERLFAVSLGHPGQFLLMLPWVVAGLAGLVFIVLTPVYCAVLFYRKEAWRAGYVLRLWGMWLFIIYAVWGASRVSVSGGKAGVGEVLFGIIGAVVCYRSAKGAKAVMDAKPARSPGETVKPTGADSPAVPIADSQRALKKPKRR